MSTPIALVILLSCGDTDQSGTVTKKSSPSSEISDSSRTEEKKTAEPRVESINDKNWKQHPDVQDIRKLVSGLLSEDAKLDAMFHTFDDMCGDKHIFKIQLSNTKEGALAMYQIIEIVGDISRDTKIFYDAKGDARFIMSEYTHSSAESNYLSRAYYKNGTLLYSPQVEKRSEKSGPRDDQKAEELVILKAKEAEQKFFSIAGECSPK